MKRFKFSLATLLKYRYLEEERAQQDLSHAACELKKQQQMLDTLQHLFQENQELTRKKQQQLFTAADLYAFIDYGQVLIKRIVVQSAQVIDAKQKHADFLHKVEEAMQKRKLVEELRQKAWDAFQFEMLKEEQANLDEMGLHSYTHKR